MKGGKGNEREGKGRGAAGWGGMGREVHGMHRKRTWVKGQGLKRSGVEKRKGASRGKERWR